ncbi:hypothetical protein D3C76_525170 [compost metagenome]
MRAMLFAGMARSYGTAPIRRVENGEAFSTTDVTPGRKVDKLRVVHPTHGHAP